MSEGWDWIGIEASDYPVVTNPALLQRDRVYCEFWRAGSGPEDAYGYVRGISMTWANWQRLRDSGEAFSLIVRHSDGREYPLLEGFNRARLSIWAAPMNPRFPHTTVGLWTRENGYV